MGINFLVKLCPWSGNEARNHLSFMLWFWSRSILLTSLTNNWILANANDSSVPPQRPRSSCVLSGFSRSCRWLVWVSGLVKPLKTYRGKDKRYVIKALGTAPERSSDSLAPNYRSALLQRSVGSPFPPELSWVCPLVPRNCVIFLWEFR